METNTNNSLENFRLLITGAGSGIGLATATLAKNRGARVSGVVQGREQAEALAAVTGTEGVFDADVTDSARMSETVEQARERMGGLDGLAACAGIFQHLGGALAGGLIVGMGESVGAMFMPGSMKQVVTFGLFVVILLFRPQGIFGRRAA